MTTGYRLLPAVLPLTLALAACGTPDDLWPAAKAPTAATVPETAQRAEAGVRVTATARPWPGEAVISDDVTPLWVSIENEGVRPVNVEYANLALVGASGNSYQALPLYRVEGDAEGAPTVRDVSPVVRPGFDSREFWLAPHYSAIYPNFPVYQRPFYYDYGYYRDYDAAATGRALPTDAMREAALPEGVLEPAGRVEGWVYFEQIPPGTESIYLRADIEDARTGQEVAVMRLPFDLPG